MHKWLNWVNDQSVFLLPGPDPLRGSPGSRCVNPSNLPKSGCLTPDPWGFPDTITRLIDRLYLQPSPLR